MYDIKVHTHGIYIDLWLYNINGEMLRLRKKGGNGVTLTQAGNMAYKRADQGICGYSATRCNTVSISSAA